MWKSLICRLSWPILVATLAACSSGNEGLPEVPDGSVEVPSGPDMPPVTHRVSGSVDFANNLVVDSDLTEPDSAIGNNTPETAQLLPNNLVTIQGVVAVEGASGDREADAVDMYRVFLQTGQTVKLDVVEFSDTSGSGAELTLEVSDIASSFQAMGAPGQFQSIEVVADTEYLIEISARRGASRYVITLDETTLTIPVQPSANENTNLDPDSTNNLGDPVSVELNRESREFVLREAIVRWTSANESWNFDIVDLIEIYPSANLDWSQAATTRAAIDNLKQRDDIVYAEPNYIRKPTAIVPNDPLYGSPLEAPVFSVVNGALDLSQIVGVIPINENNNSDQVVDSSFISQFHYEQINLPNAWESIILETGKQPGEGVIVAVSDTGVFLNHEDLTNKLTADGFDFISNAIIAKDGESDGIVGDIDNNPDDPGDGRTISSSIWHGTHVAGTIAAESNNNIGLAGVAWETQIMPLRVLGEGGGSNGDIMNSLIYAADLFDDLKPQRRADIINLSLGGGGFSMAEQQVVDAVRDAGVFIVASAGNDGNPDLSFPASYEGVVSVAAINGRKQRANYSQFNDRVDVTAPGGQFLSVGENSNIVACVGVLSTYVADGGTGVRESSNNCLQGTSMSAPHVSGVIALMKSVHPQMTPDEFDALLASGEITDDLGSPGRDDQFGHGLINAEKAVRAAINLAANQPQQNPLLAVNAESIAFNDTLGTAALNLSNTNGGSQNPTVTVQVSADWIEVDSGLSVNGIGVHQITADTTGFGTGNYKGLIQFTPDVGNLLKVDVELTVGTPEDNHPQAPHFVLFVDEQDDTSTTVQVQNDGQFSTELEQGNYRVISGTDVDKDFVVCQVGETCGTSTNIFNGQRLSVSGDQIGVNTQVQLLKSDTAQPALFDRSDVQQENGAFAVLRRTRD